MTILLHSVPWGITRLAEEFRKDSEKWCVHERGYPIARARLNDCIEVQYIFVHVSMGFR